MAKEIYNEGRVVGYSAYELYLRQQASTFPDLDPLTEREWLASMIGSGSSMILRLRSGSSGRLHIPLPSTSRLCAASSIIGSVFLGDVELDSTGNWATTVKSYGPLISNTRASHPAANASPAQYPYGSPWSDSQIAQFAEYLKVTDGIVVHPGEWSEANHQLHPDSPWMDLSDPDLAASSSVRLNINGVLANDVYILLSGWTFGPLLAGSTNLDAGAVEAAKPQDGDFLGPQRFPWASKIIFTISNQLVQSLAQASMHTVNEGTSSHPKYYAVSDSEENPVKALSMITDQGDPLPLNGQNTSISKTGVGRDGDLSWQELVTGLDENKSIDLLGDNMKKFRKDWLTYEKDDQQVDRLKLGVPGSSAGDVAINKSLHTGGAAFINNGIVVRPGTGNGCSIQSIGPTGISNHPLVLNHAVETGVNWIAFRQVGADGRPTNKVLRLYISDSVPKDKDIPVGSIGIGWK